MLVLTLVTPDLGAPLAESGAAFVDLDIAPQLDSFLAEDSELLARAAEGFVSWLYPPGSPAEIPLLAVAGTNGKTTTSRNIVSNIKDQVAHFGFIRTISYNFKALYQRHASL